MPNILFFGRFSKRLRKNLKSDYKKDLEKISFSLKKDFEKKIIHEKIISVKISVESIILRRF
jgi:hypothetical protein